MIRLIIFMVLLNLSGLSLMAQNQAPPAPLRPPAPLIYSPPETSVIGEFISSEVGFKIDFPGRPEEFKEITDEADIYTFGTYVKGSNEIVKVTEFGSEAAINPDRTRFFEQKKKEYLKDVRNELVYEKDFEQNGIIGKEFGVKQFISFQKARVFVVGNRLFEIIIDVSNWHILEKSYENKVIEFDREAARFFASFKLLEPTRTNSATVGKNNERTDVFNSKTSVFESGEGGFKVYFPVKPEKKNNQLENSFGLADLVIYSASSPTTFYGVTYFDTPTIINEAYGRRINYDRQRNALQDGLGATLISEREVAVSNYSGREYVLESDGNTITMRTFFANQRLFRILVISSGISGKISLASEKMNQGLIRTFFDSFIVIKIPEPSAQQAEFPADFGVTVKNGVFASKFFGFNMKLPPDYTVLGKDETESIKELGLEAVEKSTSKNKELVETSLAKTEVLLVATKPIISGIGNPAVIVIAAEIYSFPVFNPVAVAGFLSKEMLEKDEELTIDVRKEVIGGVDFAWYETFDKTENIRQRLYLANLNKLVLEISFTYRSAEDLPALLSALRSIEFARE